MTVSPYSLPPGPERRELLRAQGRNISPIDYTDEENAAIATDAAELGKAFEALEASAS